MSDPAPPSPAAACDVLVAGAGPVGLALACELARRGVASRVIDKAPARSTWSKALAIHARTLEILRSMGVADRFVAIGKRLRAFNAYGGRERLIHATFDGLDSPYPFVLILPQSETERLLEERLAELGQSVERGTELLSFAADDAGVTAKIRAASGAESEVRARFLVGCDGAHSTVRHALGLAFEGAEYEETFLLADARVETPLSADEVHAFLAPDGVFTLFPFHEPGRFRVVADVTSTTPASAPRREPGLEEVQALLDARGPGGGARASDIAWSSTFRFHRRLVARYRAGRVFLAGDAAHIHSPAGGQGMNTGIQDAHNLAWKLALAARGRGRDLLLDSYEAERRPIAAATIDATDRFTWLATLQNPLAQGLRNHLVPFLASFEPLRRKVVRTFAELDVGYPRSPIVAEDRGVVLGAMPGAPPGARDPRLLEPGELRHVLAIDRGNVAADEVERMERLVAERYAGEVAVTRLPFTGMAPPFAYLVRPDGYVAYRASPPSAEKLASYLERVFA